jgi:hypothetical protein
VYCAPYPPFQVDVFANAARRQPAGVEGDVDGDVERDGDTDADGDEDRDGDAEVDGDPEPDGGTDVDADGDVDTVLRKSDCAASVLPVSTPWPPV